MRNQLAAVTVEVTITGHEGDTLTVNTDDADSAFLGDVPSAVRTMTGSWQQASSRDHPTPGKLDLELIHNAPEHPALDYESLVEITITLANAPETPIPFWRGWIDELVISRRIVHHPDTRQPVTTWTWKISAGDVIARAAATKINDAPWPKEHVFGFLSGGRLRAIEAASPIPLIAQDLLNGGASLGSWQWPSDFVRPRDVDNTDVLTLCRAMSPIGAMLVHETEDGVSFRGNPGINELAWVTLIDKVDHPFLPNKDNIVGGATYRIGPAPNAVSDANTATISPDAIVETGRRINRATLLNEVSIGYYDESETQRDAYRRNTSRQSSTSQHRVATDYIEDDNVPAGPPALLVQAADAWLSMTGRPTRALSQTEVLTAHVDPAALLQLCGLGTRGTVGVDVPSPPDDLPSSWRTIAGTATVEAGRLALRLALEPASLSGQEPLTLDEIPEPETAHFSDGTPVRIGPEISALGFIPINAFSHVTKSAVRLYDGPE